MIFILSRFGGADSRQIVSRRAYKKFHSRLHHLRPPVRLFVCIGNEFTLAVSCANRHDHCDCDCG